MAIGNARRLFDICVAEMIGTAILCGFGLASIAVNTIAPERGSFLQVHISWGVGAMFGVYCARQKSPGHINPSVTFAKLIRRNIDVIDGILMIISQCIGAFLAAALVYWVYMDIDVNLNNASIFATYPRIGVTTGQAMVSSIVGTAFMILSINGVAQSKPAHKPDLTLLPIYTGVAVMTYGICFSLNTGYAINPARDIGPRFFIFLVGFPDSFARGNDLISWYWWIPIISPLIGAILANFIFDNFIKGDYWIDLGTCKSCLRRNEIDDVKNDENKNTTEL